jgi:hypothetical protein
MNFDELAKWAAEEAKKRPPMTPEEQAPFAYLRDEFADAFHAVRAAAAPSMAAQLVLHLATFAFDAYDTALEIIHPPALAMVREAGAEEAPLAQRAVWRLDDAHEVLLWCERHGEVFVLNVDLVRGFERQRPFHAALAADDEGLVANEVTCSDTHGTVVAPLPVSGHFTLQIRHAGGLARLRMEARQSAASA